MADPNPVTTVLDAKPILYGSIIHLENCSTKGGYLGASRSTIEEDVLNWSDRAVKTFTFTHLFENRVGSSSWQILPDPMAELNGLYIVPGLDDSEMVSLRVNAPDGPYLTARASNQIVSLANPSGEERKFATFKKVAGLAGSGISFESLAFENHFLRHSGFKIYLYPKSDADLYKKDASFLGEENDGKTFFRSHNYPLLYLRASKDGASVVIRTLQNRTIGDDVQYGDKIRLRNMASDATYLDIFDWVKRLQPSFDEYKNEMQNGVFTLDTDLRPAPYDQPVAEWVIKSADNESQSGAITEGRNVILENIWLRERNQSATQLTTFKRVQANMEFKESDYAGERMFVFVGNLPDGADGSNQWEITLSESSRNIYHLWGQDAGGKWLDYGSLRIGTLLSKALVRLKLDRTHVNPNTLDGKVAYEGEGAVLFKAIHAQNDRRNVYQVSHDLHGSAYDAILRSYPDGEWIFGAKRGAPIVAIDIISADNGRTFTGTITYEGDAAPISVRGMQSSTTSFTKNGRPLFYDFFKPNRWEKRIKTVGDALGTEENDRLQIDDIVARIKAQSHLGGQDKTNQENQIKNIGTMKRTMRDFWAEVQMITNGDQQDGMIRQLDQQDILPPVHMISEMIGHITSDLEIVERAIQQRRPSGGNVQSDSLLITDKLATMSFTPFQGLLADGAAITPLTYFDKSVYVRLVPYSDQFIFIGLTYDLAVSAGQNSDADTIPPFALMAIPHEVGHFIYHLEHPSLPGPAAGKSPAGAPLNASRGHQHYRGEGHSRKHRDVRPNTFGWLSNDPAIADNPYHDWCEEIFADLYGCLVSGPFTILGIQSLLASGDKSRLMRDDVQHPTPILRPYLMSEMLRVLGELEPEKWGRFRKASLILDANWTAVLDRWGIVLEDVYNGRPASIIMPNETHVHLEPFTRVNIASAIEHGRKIIEHFAKALLDTAYQGDLSSVPWCKRKRTLNGYARIFKSIVENETERIKKMQLDARDSYPVNPETIKALSDVVSADNPNYVKIGENLFETVLSSWHDGGGTGSSRGSRG